MKSRSQGSITFGTSNLSTDEVITLAKVIRKEDPQTKPEMLMEDISFIDDCLSLLKIRIIAVNHARTSKGNLRKNHTTMSMIEKRFNQYMDNTSQIE